MKKSLLLSLFFLYAGSLFSQLPPSEIKPLIGISCSHPGNDHSSAQQKYIEVISNRNAILRDNS